MKLINKFIFVLLIIILPAKALAFSINYTLGNRSDIFGADENHLGTTVEFSGSTGTLEFPLGSFSVIEIPVGTLSITTTDPLSRNLPVGFHIFEFGIPITIQGITKITLTDLLFVRDQSNDAAIPLGGRGTNTFSLTNNHNISFQLLTGGTG